MATISNNLTLQDNMTATIRSVTNAMQSTLSVVRSLEGAQLGQTFAKAAADIELANAAMSNLEDAAGKAKDAADRLGDSGGVPSFTGQIITAQIATQALEEILRRITDQVDAAFNRVDVMERFNRTMTIFTRSAEVTAYALENLKTAVNGTAYGLDVAAKSTQALVVSGMGIDEAVIHFRTLMNATSQYSDGTNASLSSVSEAWQRMATSGKVSAMDVRSITLSGIPVYKIYAAAVGQSVADVKKDLSSGEVSAEAFQQTLINALNAGVEGFPSVANAAATAGASWAGTFDNMKAAVTRGLVDLISTIDDSLETIGLGTMRETLLANAKRMESALSAFAAFVGNNIQAITLGLVLLATAAAIAALNFAVAWAVAYWPLLLIIGLVVMLINVMVQMGYTASKAISFVGMAFGFMFANIWNGVAIVWNAVANFVEFFANVWHDPVDSVRRLFVNVFDNILAVVEYVAGAIGALLGADWGGAISGFRAQLSAASAEAFGVPAIEVARMESKNVLSTAEAGRTMFGGLIDKASGLTGAIGELVTPDALAIGDDLTIGSGSDKALKTKNVDPLLDKEDIKLLVDIATNAFKVNFTQLTPEVALNIYGDIRETADANAIFDQFVDLVQEAATSDLRRS